MIAIAMPSVRRVSFTESADRKFDAGPGNRNDRARGSDFKGFCWHAPHGASVGDRAVRALPQKGGKCRYFPATDALALPRSIR